MGYSSLEYNFGITNIPKLGIIFYTWNTKLYFWIQSVHTCYIYLSFTQVFANGQFNEAIFNVSFFLHLMNNHDKVSIVSFNMSGQFQDNHIVALDLLTLNLLPIKRTVNMGRAKEVRASGKQVAATSIPPSCRHPQPPDQLWVSTGHKLTLIVIIHQEPGVGICNNRATARATTRQTQARCLCQISDYNGSLHMQL